MGILPRIANRVAVGGLMLATVASAAAQQPDGANRFLRQYCLDCHAGQDAAGNLDLTRLPAELEEEDVEPTWVRIYDRVQAGEMPPAEVEPPPPVAREDFLRSTESRLVAHQRHRDAQLGRVRGRRLTNLQLERSLHDLLGIDIPLRDQMSAEARTAGFTTVADGQAMSHFQLEQHVTVVDAALDEAFRRVASGPDEWERLLPAGKLVRRRARSRTREPELIDGHAVTWSSRLIYYGRLPSTTARQSGWYRFTVKARALKPPPDRGVWCTVRSGKCVSSAPLLGWVGAFEAQPELREVTFEAWLNAGDMLEIRPGDATLKMARFQGGQVGTGEGGPQNVPGVAIESIRMARFHRHAADRHVQRLLFAELPVHRGQQPNVLALESSDPRDDAERLVGDFATRAFRRPVAPSVAAPFVALAHRSLDHGTDLASALRVAYRAILCSPRFLYFYEQPGRLDDHAIATRLSYLLWNRPPDRELLELADAGRLDEPTAIRGQVERLLQHRHGREFVVDLAAQWLDLSLIDFTEPDRKLYPGFDAIVQQSMLDETHRYLQTMLDNDLGVELLIDSDFTFLNSRLARYYRIGSVQGDAVQKVRLEADDHRGGLITHGSILKVTANGTTTSPVIRGVWLSERLLGVEIPPPPANVPAIEPDIRGAKSIREMLAKHQADTSCASCHVKIDPPGFALENYDPSGRWRDRYFAAGRGRNRRGLPIDASFEMSDGRPFENLDEFRRLVLEDRSQLARNLAEKLLTYGTGAPIRFSDRRHVAEIVETAAATNYGLRSLLHAVTVSPIFLSK